MSGLGFLNTLLHGLEERACLEVVVGLVADVTHPGYCRGASCCSGVCSFSPLLADALLDGVGETLAVAVLVLLVRIAPWAELLKWFAEMTATLVLLATMRLDVGLESVVGGDALLLELVEPGLEIAVFVRWVSRAERGVRVVKLTRTS